MGETCYLGGCLCGSVRYQVSGIVTNLCFCHCASCRRATGAPMVPWGTLARENFRLSRGKLAEYRSSPAVTRGFCAACGTSLTYRNDARVAEIDVTLATLDDPTLLTPQMHVWVGDKLPWVSISDGRPQFTAGTSAGSL
ncbi:MAG TPA: GFA family protein [Steroidobacteraceae bacterium]